MHGAPREGEGLNQGREARAHPSTDRLRPAQDERFLKSALVPRALILSSDQREHPSKDERGLATDPLDSPPNM